jgi:hypothetical protein
MAGALLTMLVYDHFARIRSYALLLGAIGLAVFSYIGAQSAGDAGLGLVGMIFFASLTAAGGGILTDIVLGDKPVHRPTVASMCIVLLVPFIVRVGWLARRGEIRAAPFLARDPESRRPRRRWTLRPARTVGAAQLVSAGGPGSPR